MQILKKTDLEAYKKAKKIGQKKVIEILKIQNLTGRGGAGFPTAKKWEFAINTQSKTKYLICNADEGEPGTFKDNFIIRKNPETLIEGILIAADTIEAEEAFIYLRGEYEYLKEDLEKVIREVQQRSRSNLKITIVVGAGAYVCGDETAIIRSIEGYRGQAYIKPPYPPVEGLWGKPTIINNVETLTCVPLALLYNNWNPNLRLFSISGDVEKPGVYELPLGTPLPEMIELAQPKAAPKAVFFGYFGGCMPYSNLCLTPENVKGVKCVIGAGTIIVVGKNRSMIDVAETIAKFYEFESCGKCTPCREGSKRILDLITKFKTGKAEVKDCETLKDLAFHIHETSLCGLGQTATNHIITSLEHFKDEFKEKCR